MIATKLTVSTRVNKWLVANMKSALLSLPDFLFYSFFTYILDVPYCDDTTNGSPYCYNGGTFMTTCMCNCLNGFSGPQCISNLFGSN